MLPILKMKVRKLSQKRLESMRYNKINTSSKAVTSKKIYPDKAFLMFTLSLYNIAHFNLLCFWLFIIGLLISFLFLRFTSYFWLLLIKFTLKKNITICHSKNVAHKMKAILKKVALEMFRVMATLLEKVCSLPNRYFKSCNIHLDFFKVMLVYAL